MENLVTVVKSGWLQKRGEFITSWRKRFFVLYSNGNFNGYKEEPNEHMINNANGRFENTFTVNESQIICPPGAPELKFIIRCRQRDRENTRIDRNFQASTTEERDCWVSLITRTRDQLSQPDGEAPMDTDEDEFDMGKFAPPQVYRRPYTRDDFEIMRTVGRGTFGSVFIVYRKDDPEQTRMAMKVISKAVVRQKQETEHTRNEREVLATVDHPFLIKLFHAFQSRSHLYFVMEFAHGGEIYTHLARCSSFPIRRCRFYGAEIVSAFGYLHSKNIIYRDLKLENLLLDQDGHIKITDYGLCKILPQEGLTSTFCGTPEYLAPEVLRDENIIYGMSVDWWSLGVVLHEMIVGRLPFPQWDNHEDLYDSIIHDEVPEFPIRVPTEAGQLLLGLLKKIPQERLGSRGDATEVMDHPFFQSIDFEALERREIAPDFVPVTRDRDDVDNFDREFTQQTPQRLLPEGNSVTSTYDDQDFRSFDYNNRSLPDQVMA